MDRELILVGELAKRSLTTTKAIRTYEARALIAPALRAQNRYRYFAADLAKIVPVFGNMLALGLALRDVRAIFAPAEPLRDCPTDAELRDSMRRAAAIYERQIERIDTELRDLAGLREAFEVRLDRCRREIESSGAVQLPDPPAGRRLIRPGRVAYERAGPERRDTP